MYEDGRCYVGKGVIAGIIIAVAIGGILTVSFAFPQVLNQFPANISQPTSEKQTKESDSTIKTKETAEKTIPKPMSLDEVDPYYKSTSTDSGKVTKITQDKSKCTISYLRTGPPVAAELFQFEEEELSPCPFVLDLDVIKSATCLVSNAPVDLKLKVQSQCKTVYEQKDVGDVVLQVDWINPRLVARFVGQNCDISLCQTVGDGIRVTLSDPHGIKHNGKIIIYGTTSQTSPIATKAFDSVNNASWDFTHFEGGNRVTVSYIEAKVQYGSTIRLTLPNNVEIIPDEENFVLKCMFDTVGYGSC